MGPGVFGVFQLFFNHQYPKLRQSEAKALMDLFTTKEESYGGDVFCRILVMCSRRIPKKRSKNEQMATHTQAM